MEVTMTTAAKLRNHSGEIAFKNDVFRRRGHKFMITDEVQYLPDVCGLITAVQHYKDFTPSNDPYEEHDFGQLLWHGKKIFWKIDYYDALMQRWEDPISPRCNRVLTIMLASEY
jgi:hypothetical protein